MNIYAIKPKFQEFLMPIAKALAKNKVHPTTINILALIIAISGGIALFYSQDYSALLFYIPIMAFIRTALNALDGMVARINRVKNQQYGEVLNEFTDRLADVSILLGLALAPFTEMIWGMYAITSLLLVSYIGILPKAAKGSRQYVGPLGKADRMLYVSIAAILTIITKNYEIMTYFLMFVTALSIITIIRRFINAKRELKK